MPATLSHNTFAVLIRRESGLVLWAEYLTLSDAKVARDYVLTFADTIEAYIDSYDH